MVGLLLGLPGVTVGSRVVGSGEKDLDGLMVDGAALGLPGVTVGMAVLGGK